MTLPRPADGVLYQPVEDGAVLLHVRQEVYFGLDPVGAEIWELLPPACASMEEIRERMAERHPDVPRPILDVDIEEFLDSLLEAGLVALGDHP